MTANHNLMRMLAALCVVSIIAMIHANQYIKPENNVHHSNGQENVIRTKRSIAEVKISPKIEKPKTHEINPSQKLVKWFRSMVNPNTEEPIDAHTVIKKGHILLDQCVKDKYSKLSSDLSHNSNGQIFGNGKAVFETDSFCYKTLQIDGIESHFQNGRPTGKTTIFFVDGSFAKTHFVNGLLNGLYRRFWCKFGPCDHFDLEAWRKPKHLREISIYESGVRKGIVWEFKLGGGLIVGEVNRHGDLTGDNIAYIYPDMKTVIAGKFSKNVLISGQTGILEDITRASNGLMRPVYNLDDSNNEFRYSPSNLTWMGSDPLLRDPLEDKYLMVANSTLVAAGRGVFMKVNAKMGTIVGFYNGIRMASSESKLKAEDRKSPYRMDNDWAEVGQVLNIPKDFRELNEYNATLGHLINHGSKPNAWFAMIDHPRFGKIRSIALLRDVQAGQELFVDYGFLEQYAQSETAIKTIYNLSKWMSNKDDEEFHEDMKFHIKYIRNKVEYVKPYFNMLKTVAKFAGL